MKTVTVTIDLFVRAESDAQAAALVKDFLVKAKTWLMNPEREDLGVTGSMLRSLDVTRTY